MKERYTLSGYNITTDPAFQNEKFGNTPELLKQMEKLFFELKDNKNKNIIEKLNNIIIEYPKSPQLKNYLSVAFNEQGKYDKAIEVNNWILTEHPDYLFARLNRANELISKGEFDRVPEILGEAMELKSLYPDRNLFHLAEVTGFYRAAILYYTSIDNLDLAENRMNLLTEIAPEHDDTKAALLNLFNLKMKKGAERWEEENKNRITPKNSKHVPKNKTTKAPEFNHPEIQNLYHFGIKITHENLREIIALPRNTLIEDLETILKDAVERYEYFFDMRWKEETNQFVLHSLFLLNEINAVESLPKIISFLAYDDEFVEFWLGDCITETLWQCFYKLGFSNTETIKHFLLTPNIDTYVKTAASTALGQMVLHYPEKRNEILAVYTDVLSFNLTASIDDDIIDSDFLGFAIGDAIDCNLSELLPIIKQLFDKGYVSREINGDFKEIESDAKKPYQSDKKMAILNIFELYNNLIKIWPVYKEKGNDDFEEDDFENYSYEPIQQAVSNKINRNDPCPCGSGKKYKKCCIDIF